MNEDEMTDLEVRAGDELERTLDRYARLRLDPSPGQARRARSAIMEAAWRQRLAPPEAALTQPAPDAGVAVAARSPRRGPFAGWSARRLGASLAAAALAGLMVGTSVFAASRAGGPLYDTRLALEELALPADAQARLEAELALAQVRFAEIVESAAKDDPGAMEASVRGYLASLADLGEATGGPADRALVVIEQHRVILLQVLDRVPDDARSGVENALARSSAVIARLEAAGSPPPDANGGGGNGGGNGGGTSAGGGSTGGTGGKPDEPGATGGKPDEPGATGGKPDEPGATGGKPDEPGATGGKPDDPEPAATSGTPAKTPKPARSPEPDATKAEGGKP